MNWAKGFEATYYMTLVDRNTWKDTERIEITGGSVSRSDSNLIESADIDCVSYERGELLFSQGLLHRLLCLSTES